MASLKPVRAPVALLYALTLMLLALAAWNPTLPGSAGAIDLMLVMDESGSIRRDYNDRLWTAFLRQASSLPAGSRLALLRFAERSLVEIPWTPVADAGFGNPQQAPPRRNHLEGGASNIRQALVTALQQASPRRSSVILVSSDGLDTVAGENALFPGLASGPGISLFHLQPEAAATSRAMRIDSVNLPPRIVTGQSFPVSLAIRSSAETRASVEIRHNQQTVIRRDLALPPGTTRTADFWLAAERPGTQSFEFLLYDARQNIVDKLGRAADAEGGGKLLYVGNNPDGTSHRLALPQGWSSVHLRPAQLESEESFFDPFDVVLIDDLHADAISPAITRNLQRSVRQSATGLVVLGGPASFGSGAYRHSQLEQLLPVSAESSRPLPASAFLFLLDKSGSMDTPGNRQTRLADAFAAVLESAKSVRAGDESALLAFDREVQVLLPLSTRADLYSELDRPWRIQPSGGTRLTPALDTAATILAGSESPRRFLILVTDGFVEVGNIGRLQSRLQDAGIRLIVLATGDDAGLDGLRALSTASGGRLLLVKDTAQLPRFMRRQLESTQHSWSDVPVTPRLTRRLPFIEQSIPGWKAVQGHQVTRAKAAARVYLATADGDPLLAVGRQGAGSVAALPGGMLETASAHSLSAALISWINHRRQDPNLQLSHAYAAARLTLVIDALTADGAWQSAAPAQLILTDPGGISQPVSLQLVAPGRYSTVVQAPASGVYRVDIDIGERSLVSSLYLDDDGERNTDEVAAWYRQALDSGQLKPWTASALAEAISAARQAYPSRPLWLLLSLLCFIGLMAFEYRFAFSWLRRRWRGTIEERQD